MHHYFKIIILIFILSGCSLFPSQDKQGDDGGVYKSADKGDSWRQAVLIPSVNETKPNIATVNVLTLEPDPQDRYALYIGTRANGMFYTYNGAAGWFKAPVVTQSQVNDIAVDPQSKCAVYLASGNQVFKTTDCSRSWQGTYVQNDPTQLITVLDIDHFNTAIIYAGDIKGNLFKSLDYGISWTNIARFNNSIKEIIVDNIDTRIIYVATQSKGIKKSNDGGETWKDIKEPLKEFPGSDTYQKLIVNPGKVNSLFYASLYGLLKTVDGGESWEEIPLLTPPRSVTIFALAVNPHNDQEIYYTTNRTFYKTVDGGENWITKKLPTGRIPNQLFVDPEEPNIIYMGVAGPQK